MDELKKPKKIKKIKKPKQVKKSTVRRKLDKAWSQAICNKNNGRCEVCGRPANNPHHYIGRTNLTLRWDIKNGILTCAGCHLFSNESFHKNPIWGTNWMKTHRPDDYEYLEAKMNIVSKWSTDDLLTMLDRLIV